MQAVDPKLFKAVVAIAPVTNFSDRLRRAQFNSGYLLEQQRTGTITRQLAAWAAILAVPTAIAGIYGMNFEHMPELKTRYGYFVVLAVILLICSILYRRFRKLNWL